MNALLKKIGQEIWDRVVVSNKSTIIGWLLSAAIIGADQVALAVAGWHSPYAATAAIVVGLIGTALKNKAKVAAAGVALLLAFGLAAPAFAQDPTPVTSVSPASVDFGDLSLHLNVSVVAFSYDVTNKAYLGQGQIGGLYSLTSKRLYDAGLVAGGAIAFDSSSRPSGQINAGLVTPRLSLPNSPLGLRGAVLYTRRFGPNAANLISVAPTISF